MSDASDKGSLLIYCPRCKRKTRRMTANIVALERPLVCRDCLQHSAPPRQAELKEGSK